MSYEQEDTCHMRRTQTSLEVTWPTVTKWKYKHRQSDDKPSNKKHKRYTHCNRTAHHTDARAAVQAEAQRAQAEAQRITDARAEAPCRTASWYRGSC
jgi:hypothetical protein